ncbi:cysteine desulfurase family protein [Desulfitobacterium sp.]|uniref:cysteine desulfurase family protein n=1 Tax=Desulfitobacterium sp. TaxID=49981 RepID=UPI002CF7D254|nr:cysteine desulfurase family protein [Desulfitobacterium sp.]HVJ50619.1 cysteine desulfurase family protein [Desulfitobacterium sp.]
MEIYLDNAATTMVDKEILSIMRTYIVDKFYNPSSLYVAAKEVKMELEKSRIRIAEALGCMKNEIFFTSSATEANNWALKGIASQFSKKGNHIITSQIEHSSVLETCKYLEKNGFEITYLPVDQYGIVSLSELVKSIKRETILISIMAANNEIGSIQPINEIGIIAKENNILFHCDAVQSIGQVDMNINKDNISLMSISGHKIHGPKGAALLYLRYGTLIEPLIHGGGQEGKLRSGTENVASCIGLSYAVQKAISESNEKCRKQEILRDEIINKILVDVSGSKLNGHPQDRLSNNINISIEGVDGKFLAYNLDKVGIKCSTGSACNCGGDASHVLLATGLPVSLAKNTIRLTIDDKLTSEKINYCVDNIKMIVEKARAWSVRSND